MEEDDVTLYQMLTGVRAFSATDPLEITLQRILTWCAG